MRQVRSLRRARGAEVRAETLAGLGGPYRRQLFEILGFVPRSPISCYCDGGRPVYVHECGDRTRQTQNPLESRVAGECCCRRLRATDLKGNESGGDGRGLCGGRVRSPPNGRRRAPCLRRARLPGVFGRQQLGSFCYPRARDLQNLRTFSFSLSLSNVDLDEQQDCYGGELPRWVSRSDPHAGFRIADGAEEPCRSLSSLRGAHSGGWVSKR